MSEASLAALPRLGFGAAALGNLYTAVTDAEAAGTIEAALSGGLRLFDTAPYYGHGLSETRLGNGLSNAPDVMISTKVGRSLADGEPPGETGFVDAARARPYFDYGRDAVLAQVEGSLARLKRDRVDLLFVHDIGAQTHGEAHSRYFRQALDGAFPALAELKASGATRGIGIGVNEVAVCLETLSAVSIDVILLAGRYTLLDQSALAELLPACLAKGVRVIVGGPFNSGVLAGGNHFDYGRVPAGVWDRVRAMAAVCARHRVPLAAAALQFPLAHAAVSTVIPGARTVGEVNENMALLDLPIPADLWAELRAFGLLPADAPVPVGR